MEDKVAIVAGGSRDIGRAVSLALAEAGASVAVNYFNDAAAGKGTVESIRRRGGAAIAVAGDMTRRGDVEKLVGETCREFGGSIDVLVNVVGGLIARKTLAEMDEEFLEHVLRLNVTSTFLTTQCVLAHMAEQGSIINLASQAGRDGGGPGAAAYAASKGAVMSLTRAMAKELGPVGIRVNCVCPGMIDTAFHDTFTKDAVRANVAAATPLRREGEAEEVAGLVAYLASSRASFITGASFDINGGAFFS
ncbi:MAG: glucose 1-dehydrogenase [Gammaproteobacteria bacterium]|nr:glucose 1-dehydrogenase [Gammaproteobacteria bacterium]MCY4165008.1 glucose 1-dehydrogenase [Gammaproteobacteria bacterium]MCY4340234.1 glucose 1-dehydrogenase [Gammaproteobacteria bacterium]